MNEVEFGSKILYIFGKYSKYTTSSTSISKTLDGFSRNHIVAKDFLSLEAIPMRLLLLRNFVKRQENK